MMRTLTAIGLGWVILAGCVGRIGDGNEVGGPPLTTQSGPFVCDPSAAAPTASPIRRLAKTYLQNAVTDFVSALSDDHRAAFLATIQTRLDLIPTDSAEDYAESDNSVTQDHVDAVFGLAVAMAAKLADDATGYAPEMLSVCGAGATKSSLGEDGCLTSFVQHYGQKAFRRPLAATEVDDFKAYYTGAIAAGLDGFAALVGRLIAHPYFYYRFDDAGDLVSGTDGQDAVYRLTKWELLSKITFLFWAAPPSDELYDRVATSDITQDADLGDLVDDVLADPRAESGIVRFYREWLLLDKTKTPATDGNIAAGNALLTAAGIDALPDTYREDMIGEVLDLAKHYTLSVAGTVDDLLTSRYSFAKTPEIATLYGVLPWDGTPDHLVPVPDGDRTGLLTRAAFVTSNAEYTRPVIKGKRIRTRLLCDAIPLPPPNLDIKPLTHPIDETTRQATDQATADQVCQACHSKMNSFGYLSENYDPVGRRRDKELRFTTGSADVASSLDIDTKASVSLDDGAARELADADALGAYLAQSGQVHTCLVRNYFEYVSGRKEDDKADGCDLAGMRGELTRSGGSIQAMLKQTVMQSSFRQRKVQ